MDCTVDSMLTTTPFFRPREGGLPMPMISSAPSDLISPTMATTLLVPMSRPTTKLRSDRLAMCFQNFLQVARASERDAGNAAGMDGGPGTAAGTLAGALRQPMAKPLE